MRVLLFPFGYFPIVWTRAIGSFLGHLIYYFLPSFRKRTLSHLSLVFPDLPLQERVLLAKKSLASLCMTFLEYPKLDKMQKIHPFALCKNPERALKLLQEGYPPIFFCGHQANWEVLFLEGTSRMPGVAIGRPIKNHKLYAWITKIREKFGGKMITPKNALKEGLRALKKGSFLGVVGDQGMPDSGFRVPFLGKMAWTSPLPALLSYRTGSPILVAMTRRSRTGYTITYSDPLFPNLDQPMEEEVSRLMKETLLIFEKSVLDAPEEWLWIHNRWKQQPLSHIKRPYRHESLCVVLEKQEHLPYLFTLKEIYPYEWISVFMPKSWEKAPLPQDLEVYFYEDLQEVKVKDFRFKLLFNFTSDKSISSHFKKLSVFTVVTLKNLKNTSLKELLSHAS